MTLISKILADKSEAAVKSGVAEPQKNCGELSFRHFVLLSTRE